MLAHYFSTSLSVTCTPPAVVHFWIQNVMVNGQQQNNYYKNTKYCSFSPCGFLVLILWVSGKNLSNTWMWHDNTNNKVFYHYHKLWIRRSWQPKYPYSLISVIDKLQVYLLMQYLHFSMYVHMYQITCSVVARLSNHHQGLPQGLFSVCSYLLKPTGNHGQTQEGVLGVVF